LTPTRKKETNTMMTRKDYVATAEILARHYDTITIAEEESFDALANKFADMFAADNERFLRERFLDACYEETVVQIPNG